MACKTNYLFSLSPLDQILISSIARQKSLRVASCSSCKTLFIKIYYNKKFCSEKCFDVKFIKKDVKERAKQYYLDNKENMAIKHKKYYEKNKKKIKKQQKIYWEENKEKIMEKNKIYWKENQDRIDIYQKEYMKEYIESGELNKTMLKYYHQLNQDDKQKWTSRRRTNYHRQEILDYYGNKCCVCGNISRLEIHHTDYTWIKEGSNRNSLSLNIHKVKVLCKACHRKEHNK